MPPGHDFIYIKCQELAVSTRDHLKSNHVLINLQLKLHSRKNDEVIGNRYYLVIFCLQEMHTQVKADLELVSQPARTGNSLCLHRKGSCDTKSYPTPKRLFCLSFLGFPLAIESGYFGQCRSKRLVLS